MTVSELSGALLPVFNNWFNNLKKHHQTGSLSSTTTLYCRDTIQLYEVGDYFVLELTGDTPLQAFKGVGFNKKIKKAASLTSLVNGGTAVRVDHQLPAELTIKNPNEVWPHLAIASYNAYDSQQKQLRPTVLQKALQQSSVLPIAIENNPNGTLLANALSLRLEAPKLHLRYLPFLWILHKQTPAVQLVHSAIARLNETFPKRDHLIGIYGNTLQEQLVATLQRAAPDTFRQVLKEQGHQIAQLLGYQALKTGVALPNSPYGTVDAFLEKVDGHCDLLHLSAGMGLASNQKGKKNKPNLSAYVLELKALWAAYQAGASLLKQEHGIELSTPPLLIGVVQNTHQVYQQALQTVAKETEGDVLLLTFEALAKLENWKIKNE